LVLEPEGKNEKINKKKKKKKKPATGDRFLLPGGEF